MAAELASKEKKETLMKDLRDGQIAIIVGDNGYAGRIVQRFGDEGFVTIGGHKGDSFPSRDSLLPVRILEEGELIKITDNN